MENTVALVSGMVAVMAFLLSVYNTWSAHMCKSERIRLSTSLVTVVGDKAMCIMECDKNFSTIASRNKELKHALIGMQITNLSEFTVYIEEIGFAANKRLSSDRGNVPIPVYASGARNLNLGTGQTVVMPIELRSRDSVMLLVDEPDTTQLIKNGMTKAYVKTACGSVKCCDAMEMLLFLAHKPL